MTGPGNCLCEIHAGMLERFKLARSSAYPSSGMQIRLLSGGQGLAPRKHSDPHLIRKRAFYSPVQFEVEFASLDGEPVHLFFLLISPPQRPGDHLRALENISRQLRDDTFCRFLKQSKTAEDIQQLLEEADNNQFVS